jgi:hypothetical protein
LTILSSIRLYSLHRVSKSWNIRRLQFHSKSANLYLHISCVFQMAPGDFASSRIERVDI